MKEKITAILRAQYKASGEMSTGKAEAVCRIFDLCVKHGLDFKRVTLSERIYNRAKELKQL